MSITPFVLDNSVVMAWILGEENPRADRVIDLLADTEARVPGIWPLDFGNALVTAERRHRLTEADVVRVRELVLALPIRVVGETSDRVLTVILGLARDQGLSVYDACYLDLAMREGLPLATLDDRMQGAARRCSVPLVIEAPEGATAQAKRAPGKKRGPPKQVRPAREEDEAAAGDRPDPDSALRIE